jgi:hypothetical protein
LGKLTGANLRRGTPSDYSNFLDRLFGLRVPALVLLCARPFDAAPIDRRLVNCLVVLIFRSFSIATMHSID